MEDEQLYESLINNYKISPLKIQKVKNAYKITTENDEYSLKIMHSSLKHLLFILKAMKHLENNSFSGSVKIISTIDNIDYITIENNFAYLTKWIQSRECNYENPIELELATRALAELHVKSEGFRITKDIEPRVGWFKWPQNFENRVENLVDFYKEGQICAGKTEFNDLYQRELSTEIQRADSALKRLINTNYVERMEEQILSTGFCHHDFAHHNVLIGPCDVVKIIDFDYCILDTNLHDVASLMVRKMKNSRWTIKKALNIFNIYSEVNELYIEDLKIIAAFIEFPQEFWQLGIQYYTERLKWKEEIFLRRLTKYLEDRVDRAEFVKNLFDIKL